MAHSDGETLPLSQDSFMESDEENLSSDDESLLDDSGDGDYCPSDDFFEDDEIYESINDVHTRKRPANSSPVQEPELLDSSENTSPPKKRQRTCKPLTNNQSWKTERDPDITLPTLRFLPVREPGVQLSASDNHTPLELFKLFFSENTVEVLCRNTNKLAARNQANGAKYKWTNVTVPEFYKYIGLVFYMSLVRLNTVVDYWRRDNIFSVSFPKEVMMRDRYRTISWNVHMSDPDEDRENDAKKGTPLYDRLFRAKPLMHTIQDACKAFYHPRRNLSIDERMVACRAHTGMTQYMKDKPTKWGIKLFVLADSSNGYTVDFSIFAGKNLIPSGQGIAYDTVMSLINRKYLGSGYHIYMDNFYTSAKLFRDLHAHKYGACGTYRDSQRSALLQKSGRGAFRWRRDGPLLFVKWMDSREVNMCSTIHTAYKGHTIQRKIKNDNGIWTSKSYPCPEPVMEYNKHMGGVDLSDQLIQYYSAQHKVQRWYRKLFFHFVDIAATNAYLIYKELRQQKNQDKVSHRMFMEELTAQLCGLTSAKIIPKGLQKLPGPSHGDHHLPISVERGDSDGRKNCFYCRKYRKKPTKTVWRCKACEIHLCLTVHRNCFEAWHTMDHTSCCINGLQVKTESLKSEEDQVKTESLKGEEDQIKTESLRGEEDQVKTESLRSEEDQVKTESSKGQGQVETESLNCDEDHVEAESLKSQDDQVKTKSLKIQNDQVETESLNCEEDQVETESLKSQDDQVETESLKGEEDQVKTEFLKSQDQVETESFKSQDDQVETESLNCDEDHVETESLKGQDDQVKTKSLKSQDDQVETESLNCEEDQVETESLKSRDDQVETESLKGEEDQVKTESLKSQDDQVKTKSLNCEEDQVETESLKSRDDQVETESLKGEEDQVKAESLKSQDDQVKTKSLNCEEDQVETESLKSRDDQVETESLKGEEDQVKTEFLRSQDQVETESLKSQDDQVETESQGQVETKSLKSQDNQVEAESLKGEEKQVKTESLKGQDQFKTKSLKGQDDQVETESLKGEADQVETKALKGEIDQVMSESLKSQYQVKTETSGF